MLITHRARRDPLRRSRWSLAGWPCLLVVAACGPDASADRTFDAAAASSGAAREGGTGAEYVGVDACAECHERETARWRGSHHDLAMDVATEETVLGDFDNATLRHAGLTSTFIRSDGRFLVRTDGPDGALADFEIRYTFGVEPLQQYLVEFPGGRLQALPLAWDTRPVSEGGGRWFHLYPDERIPPGDPLHWTGPNQNWNFMCAECHSTDLAKNYDESSDTYLTTFSEIDVACEACHGPGSAHVEAARGGARGAAGLVVRFDRTDPGVWIRAPGTATAERHTPRRPDAQLDTCARCHSRRRVVAPSYRHGRPLTDTHAPRLLEAGLYGADGSPIDEVYVYGSFLQSRMHAAGVVCSDCHDAHSLELHVSGNALCGRCHDPLRFDTPTHHFHPAGTESATCVACHMPSRTYMVVDPRRDHAFRVPRPDLAAETGDPDVCTGCHGDQDAEWAAARVVEWYGETRRRGPEWARALAAGRRRAASAPAALRATAADPDVPGIVRATALSLLSPWPEAALEAAGPGIREDDPLVRTAAVPLFQALPPDERWAPLHDLLTDDALTVRIEAARALAAVRIPDADTQAFHRALDEFEAALGANADRAEAQVNLGNLALDRGDTAAARFRYRRALERDPANVPARVNLADLDRGVGAGREAGAGDLDGEALLREGLRLRPDAAALHHALGLLLVREGRVVEAIPSLAEAARLEPDPPRFAYVHAIALHSTGRVDEAIALLEALHLRFTGDLQVLEALAALHRDAGNRAEADRYARRLARLRSSRGSPTGPD